MNKPYRTKEHLRREIIKSTAMLLLAIVLLLSFVFAWFGTKIPPVSDFLLSVNTDKGDVIVDSSTTAGWTAVIPAVTKAEDPTISATDLSKVILIRPLQVVSRAEEIDVTVKTDPGLYYYIDDNYVLSEDNEAKYAEIIKANFSKSDEENTNNKGITIHYDESDHDDEQNNNKQMIAIVYWADYDMYHETIRTNGNIQLNVLIEIDSDKQKNEG